MAQPISDLKWNKVIKELGDFIGGAHWITNWYSGAAHNEYIDTEWHHYDCSAFDEAVNDVNNPFDVEIATFSNGVKLVISLWKSIYNYMQVEGEWRYKYNGVYSAVPYAQVGTYSSSGAICSFSVLKAWGINIGLITNYCGEQAQLSGGVIEDVTPASYVGFICCMPYQYNSLLQSWDHLHNGTMCMANRDYPEAAITLPDGFYYPGDTYSGPVFVSENWRFDDLDALIASIQAVNPDIPVDLEIKEGGLDDPPQEDDPSNPGGGGGNFDDRSDPIDFPDLPTGGPISTGSIKAFLVTDTHIKAVFRRLWNNSLFDVTTWQKVLEEPMDAIVSLTCVPIIPTNDATGAHIQLGNIDTEVVAPVITDQYVTIDMGSLTIAEYWGSALDYSPYTKVDIYIPGCGIRPVKPEDVIGVTLRLKYNIDVLTGNFTASLKCGQSVLYKFQGNFKATVPITSRIYSALESVMKGAGQAATSYATGAMTAEARPDSTPESVNAAATRSAAGAAINSAINVAMSKVQIQRSGDISGSTSLLDDFTPYVIVHRPQQSLASNFKKFKGYPSNISAKLSTLTGYTEVEYIHLTGIDGATDTELKMIEGLLKSGVII